MTKRQREEGASAVEYRLMIVAADTAVVSMLGGMVRDAFAGHSARFSLPMNSQSC